MANERTLEVWGRTEEVIGVPFFEVFPELVEQGFRAVLEKVLQTGKSEYLYEVPATWRINGKQQTSYLDCIYQPFYETDTDTTPTGVICVAHDQTEQFLARKKAEESEQRFRDLIAEADVATAVYFGREMRIRYANETMIRVWGKDHPVVGKTLREALPELEGQPFLAQLDHVFTTGETYWGKEDPASLMVNGKLQTSYFNFTFKALRNSDGEIYGILNMATDVTGQVMSRKMVEQSERNLRNTILQSPVAMSILKGDSFVVEVANARMFEIWGKSEKEMLGKPVFECLPEVRNQGLEEILHNVYTKGERFIANERPLPLPRNGGVETVYANFVYEPFREGNGHISGVIVVAIDVTEQVVARKKALEAEETAKLAIASAELGTFEIDLRTDYIITSPRFDEIFDIEHTNNRQAYMDVIHPDDREVRSRAYVKAYETGLLDYEARMVGKSDIQRWVRIKGRIFFDEHRQPLKISAVAQDITEEKQFAEELSRQVKERTLELEQFTYVSHHDLQEPLRKITMFTDMVRAESYNQLSEAAQSRLDKVT
jgi:PAS domain S-box-containing protein